MKYIVLSLLLALASVSHAAAFPQQPLLVVANHTFTDLTNLITLTCYVNTNGDNCTMRKPNGTSGYAVTSGKTLTISAISITQLQASSGGAARLTVCKQTDNDVGFDSATALTNPVYVGGSSSLTLGTAGGGSFAGTRVEIPMNFQVAASKYFTCSNATGSNLAYTIEAYGYEN